MQLLFTGSLGSGASYNVSAVLCVLATGLDRAAVIRSSGASGGADAECPPAIQMSKHGPLVPCNVWLTVQMPPKQLSSRPMWRLCSLAGCHEEAKGAIMLAEAVIAFWSAAGPSCMQDS